MRLELKGSFDEPNPELWETFFPSSEPTRDGDKILQSLKASGLYATVARRSARALANRPPGRAATKRPSRKVTGNRSSIEATTCRSSARATRSTQSTWRKTLTQGWKDIPQPPRSKQHNIKERDITAALVPIINAIISHEGLSETRITVDCQDHGIPTFDDNSLKPDVFLWGKGSPAFRDVYGIPPSSLRRGKDGKLVDNIYLVDWRWCVIPVEIKTDRSRYEDNDKAMFQLATYVREVFKAQPHRRFVPSLLFTESAVEFFLWDHAGVIFSDPFDYHAEASRFCRIIATIVSWKDEELGFDTSAGFVHDTLHIRTRSQLYVVEPTMIPVAQAYGIRNAGTTSWKARATNDKDVQHIILDTWADNWEINKEIWETVRHIRSNGRFQSPAEWVSFDVIRIPCSVDDHDAPIDSVGLIGGASGAQTTWFIIAQFGDIVESTAHHCEHSPALWSLYTYCEM
jgi:Fungal protein kinase